MTTLEPGNTGTIDRNQSFYELACIQIVSVGLPDLFYGKYIYDTYGIGTAICSIFLGNLILWLIGIAIISMVYQERTNAVENIRGYLGRIGGITFALVLVFSFLAWYIYHINSCLTFLDKIPQVNRFFQLDFDVRVGAFLGLVTATLAIGGIRTLKRLTIILFPILLFYNFFVIFFIKEWPVFSGTWGISVAGVVATILFELPGIINLPTFFRHSKSRADSFLALSLMTIFITLFECSTTWMIFSGGLDFIYSSSNFHLIGLFVIPIIFMLFATSICSNMLNIYLASACYESFIPRFEGTKGHAIMGLVGTAAYTFIQISAPVTFLINLSNDFIAIVGVVLLIGVLARLIIRHRPRRYEKAVNFATWVAGCAVAGWFEVMHPEESVRALFCGMGGSVLFFLGVFFVEETLWSVRKLLRKA